MDSDEDLIKGVIQRETRAFFMRDFESWADCWFHSECSRRLAALSGGGIFWQEGYDSNASEIQRMFAKHFTPNPEAAQNLRRDNWSLRVSSEMAWVSFDQYGPETDDPLVKVGLSHELRVMEKIGGEWKISMAAQCETDIKYEAFPVVLIEPSSRITWMNGHARDALRIHPALARSGAYLRGRHLPDEKSLRRHVEELASLTVLDTRPTLTEPRNNARRPVILTGGEADGRYVVWLTARADTIQVSFDDSMQNSVKLGEAVKLYRLSASQERLTGLLLEGHDLVSAAEMMGVSQSTAKTHLQRTFDKTGTRSQTALVASVLGLPPPR